MYSCLIFSIDSPCDRRSLAFSTNFSQHGFSCLGQCARWHASSQYRASRHPPQTQSRGSERSYCFPQPEQMRRRMRGQYFRMRGQRLKAFIMISGLGRVPCLLKYALKLLRSSASRVTVSVKATIALSHRGSLVISADDPSPFGGMAAMAAFSSAAAAAMAAARRSGDKVGAEGDELSFRLTVSTSIGIRPRRDASEIGKPPRCLLDFLPMARPRVNGPAADDYVGANRLGQAQARAAWGWVQEPKT